MNPAVSIVDQYCFDVYVGSKNIAGTKKGKLDIAPLNHLPLLPSGPGGFDRSWSYKTYPVQKYNFFLYLDILYIIFYKKKQSTTIQYFTNTKHNIRNQIYSFVTIYL